MPKSALRQDFLQGMSRAATTVNIVTTDGAGGRAGVTVSAMSSVSADGAAPTLLICVHEQSRTADIILKNGCFAVNVLRDDQSGVSDIFAGRSGEDVDRFAGLSWAPMATGAPRLVDPLVAFDCRLQSARRVGTHHVFIGEVQDIYVARHGNPLVYADRAYGSAVRLMTPEPRPGPDTNAGNGETLRIGALLTYGPYLLPPVLEALETDRRALALDLHEGDQRQLLDLLQAGKIDMAFLYGHDLPAGLRTWDVTDVSVHVLLPEGDPLARRAVVDPADLLDRGLVLLDLPVTREFFLTAFDGIGTPRITHRAKSFEMVRSLVGHGLGYSLLATKPASSMSYDGKAVVTRPIAGGGPATRIALCWPEDRALPDVAARFVHHAGTAFGRDVPEI